MATVEHEDIAGIKELAELLHSIPTTVNSWHARSYINGFPEHIAVVSGAPAWDRMAVVNWWIQFTPKRAIPKVGSINDDIRRKAEEWQAGKLTLNSQLSSMVNSSN